MIRLRGSLAILICTFLTVITFTSCSDSGNEVVEEVTGSRAVKQFHKSKEDIQKITEKQTERFQNMAEEKKN